MALFEVTTVVSTTHVPPEAFVAHENNPAGAALHDATLGLAAVPTPWQFVVVLIVTPPPAPLVLNVGGVTGSEFVGTETETPLSTKVQVTPESKQVKFPI